MEYLIGLLDWLDRHAGAVQAISAVLVAVLTGVVAKLTSRYVNLTQILANAATQQAEIARLQAASTRSLEEAAKEQTRLAESQVEERRRAKVEAASRAKRRLSALTSRLLFHYADAPPAEPAESYFRNAPAIDKSELDAVREAGVASEEVEPTEIEAFLYSIGFMNDLHEKVRGTQPRHGYTFSEAEKRQYVIHLANIRATLENIRRVHPPEGGGDEIGFGRQ